MSEQSQTEQNPNQPSASVGSNRSLWVWVMAGVAIGVIVFGIAWLLNRNGHTPAPPPPVTATPVIVAANTVPPADVPPTITTTAPAATVTPFVTYTVHSGDVLSGIAERFGVRASAIHEANGETLTNPDRLQIGQELRIPFSGLQTPLPLPTFTPIPSATPVASNTKQKRFQHTVRRGEVLSTIAQKYGVSLQALRAANNLRSDVIRVGDTLIIPSPAKP